MKNFQCRRERVRKRRGEAFVMPHDDGLKQMKVFPSFSFFLGCWGAFGDLLAWNSSMCWKFFIQKHPSSSLPFLHKEPYLFFTHKVGKITQKSNFQKLLSEWTILPNKKIVNKNEIFWMIFNHCAVDAGFFLADCNIMEIGNDCKLTLHHNLKCKHHTNIRQLILNANWNSLQQTVKQKHEGEALMLCHVQCNPTVDLSPWRSANKAVIFCLENHLADKNGGKAFLLH